MNIAKIGILTVFILCSIFLLIACKSSENSASSADIAVKYESNTLLNKYDIDISLNGRNLGSMKQGESKTFPATLNSGVNRLRANRVDNTNNSFEVEFDNIGDGKYSFTINARMGGLEARHTSGPREGVYTSLFYIIGMAFIAGVIIFFIKDG